MVSDQCSVFVSFILSEFLTLCCCLSKINKGSLFQICDLCL